MNIHKGFVLPVDKFTPHLSVSNPEMMELNFLYPTNGKKSFEKIYNYPRYGLGFNLIDFKNDAFGQGLTAMFVTETPLLKFRQSYFHFTAGVGIGFITNPFHRQRNYRNIAIGSVINSSFLIRIGFVKHISPNVKLRAGIGVTHMSNGAMKLPNLGINIVSAYLGIIFRQKPIQYYSSPIDTSGRSRRIFFNTFATFGFVEQYPTGGEKYNVYNIQINAYKQISKILYLNMGLDYFHNTILQNFRKDNVYEKYITDRIGLAGGLNLEAGKFNVLFQLGYYLYKPQPIDDWLYQRYAVTYFFSKNIFGLFAMKSQLGSVDNLEFGVGYRFRKR